MKINRQKLGISLVLAISGLLASCIMPESVKAHQKFVNEQVITNPDIQSGFIESDEFKLHYRSNGKPLKAIAVWVHGTPGSWNDIGKLLIDESFLSGVLLVSLDRPGWGLSQFKDEPRIASRFSEQARLIKPLLSQLNKDYEGVPLILVGHSWGGSLVPYIGVEYPDLIDGIIVLAGGLNPELVKPRWYNKAGKVVYPLLSESMQAANDEVYALSQELRIMSGRWGELKMPVIVVQGEDDSLVAPRNAAYAESQLNPKNSHILKLPNQGHLLQIERTDLIAKCIIAMADSSLEQCENNR